MKTIELTARPYKKTFGDYTYFNQRIDLKQFPYLYNELSTLFIQDGFQVARTETNLHKGITVHCNKDSKGYRSLMEFTADLRALLEVANHLYAK